MPPSQRAFLELAVARNVLRFGQFTLKSGRVSPYFFNAGLFDSGAALATLGAAYADAAVRSGLAFDMLFGPAYKGIVLAAVTATALAQQHGRDLPFAYDRKEAKDHGEGGVLVGAPLRGRVLIVDDVITAGTAIRQSIALIRAAGAEPAGVLLALDREERGQGELSASQDLTREHGIPVVAIARLRDLLAWTADHPELDRHRPALEAYRDRYGI
ncbi:MAG: orotate phosphoribosyltransferase [Xanthomonadales bacterium]|nr:orotate phosphoribosyltransferase [Xanthomonadales bacterium]MCC6594931.1 orotate phosphoribosyltransferase [Rhodanobacteraceae bacterium]MDL1869964.1 orotate phosphoribosyltransferase [Gammaproteobacteria bacterium PRO6]